MVRIGAGRTGGGGGREGGSRDRSALNSSASPEARRDYGVAMGSLEGRARTDALAHAAEARRPEDARRALREAEELASGQRTPERFSFEATAGTPNADGELPLDLVFYSSTDSPIDLERYVPELSGVEVLLTKDADARDEVMMESDTVLRIPSRTVGRRTNPPAKAAEQVLEVFQAAIASKLPETKTEDSARKKLEEALSGLYEESSAIKRRAKYKNLEATLVAAQEKKDNALRDRILTVVERIQTEENVDLFAPFGGKDGWKKHYEAERNAARAAERYLFAPKEAKKDDHHGHGHDDHHDDHAPKSLLSPSTYIDAAKGVALDTGEVLKGMKNDLAIRARMIDAHFEEEEDAVKHALEEGKISETKAAFKNAWLETKRLALKYPGTALKATGYAAGMAAVPAIGIGLSLWDLTGLPGFRMAREELANWANWIMHTLELPWQIPTGAKKGGGHGGGGHH